MAEMGRPAGVRAQLNRAARRPWLLAAAVGAVVAVLALAVSLAVIGTWRAENADLEGDLTAAQDALASAEDEITATSSEVDRVTSSLQEAERRLDVSRETAGRLRAEKAELQAVVDEVGDLDARLAEAEAASAELEEREAALVGAEQEQAARSFGGGIWLVGEDIEPGRYRSDGTTGLCYWSINRAGSNGDIIDNDLVDGGRPTVTLSEGQEFESDDCGTWTRQD